MLRVPELSEVVKYLFEGLAVIVAAYFLTGKKTQPVELFLLGLTSAVSFYVLDLFAPAVGKGTRQGAGFGIGLKTVGANPTMIGGATPRPWEWYNPSGEPVIESETSEGFESRVQFDEVEEDLGKPYKLKDGQYAAKVLLPGYNENVAPYNKAHPLESDYPSPWENKE